MNFTVGRICRFRFGATACNELFPCRHENHPDSIDKHGTISSSTRKDLHRTQRVIMKTERNRHAQLNCRTVRQNVVHTEESVSVSVCPDGAREVEGSTSPVRLESETCDVGNASALCSIRIASAAGPGGIENDANGDRVLDDGDVAENPVAPDDAVQYVVSVSDSSESKGDARGSVMLSFAASMRVRTSVCTHCMV